MSDISMCECDGPPPPPPHLRDDEVRVGQHVEVLYGLQQRAHHPHGAGGGTAFVLQGKRGGGGDATHWKGETAWGGRRDRPRSAWDGEGGKGAAGERVTNCWRDETSGITLQQRYISHKSSAYH